MKAFVGTSLTGGHVDTTRRGNGDGKRGSRGAGQARVTIVNESLEVLLLGLALVGADAQTAAYEGAITGFCPGERNRLWQGWRLLRWGRSMMIAQPDDP